MKKGIKSLMLIAAAAMTFTSCQKEDKAQVNDGKGTVKVNFTSVADGTKTYFGDRTTDKYPTLWTGDEKVGITYLDTDLDNEGNNVVEVNGKGETTTFSAELAEPSSKEGSIFVFSPWYKGNYTDADAGGFTRYSSTNKNANVVIPTTQVSTPTSCDPKAQLLVAKYGFTNGVANNVDVIFTHATAYGKVTINGVDAKIKTVKIDFGQNVTGTGLYYYTADNEQYGNKAGELKAGNKYNNTYVEIDNSKYPCDKTFWFGIPATDCSKNKVVVTVTADNGKTFKKEIQGQSSNGKSLKFDQGVITSFTVNVKEYTAPVVDVVATLTFPDENKDNNSVNAYDGEWTAKSGAFEWTMKAFNNHGWKDNWSWIRCGSKNFESTATITTNAAMSDAIKAVNVTVDKYTAVDGTTTYLQVASTKDGLETAAKVEVTMAKGVLTYNIATPQPNMFYRITYYCPKGSKASGNGYIQISKVEYVK